MQTARATPRSDALDAYARDGFIHRPGLLPPGPLQAVRRDLADLIREHLGEALDPHDPQVAAALAADRSTQATIYRAVRHRPSVRALARHPALVLAVRALRPGPLAVFETCPVRIDTPLETSELAVWHQDHFYVGGDPDNITAWIPLQDTGVVEGCLQVMPGTHHLGPVPHPRAVLGKRHLPDDVARHPIRLVPAARGDAILFHGCLLHSGSLNLSDRTRYSVQVRFTRPDRPADPRMGAVIPL